MKTRGRLLLPVFTLGFALLNPGCDNVALVGRPTLEPGAGIEDIELVAQVEGFDTRHREIYLRTNEGPTRVVEYTPDARVIIEGREHPITALRTGDPVAMQIQKDARGGDFTNLIRVRRTAGEQAGIGQAPRMESLEGTVERVDDRRGFFELRPRSGGLIRVYLSYNPPPQTEERFRTVRVGDFVRVEGERIADDRLELAAFL